MNLFYSFQMDLNIDIQEYQNGIN